MLPWLSVFGQKQLSFSVWGGYGNLVQQRLSGERWLGFAGIRQRQRTVTDLKFAGV